MDICKNYFEYMCYTACGFPKVTLNGTKQDWILLHNKAKQLLETKVEPEFGKKWGDALLPVLTRYVVHSSLMYIVLHAYELIFTNSGYRLFV